MQLYFEEGNRKLREFGLAYLNFIGRLYHLIRLRRLSMESQGNKILGYFGDIYCDKVNKS